METEGKIKELEGKIESLNILLSRRLQYLEGNKEYELELESKRRIKEMLSIPVTIRLKNTDAVTAANYGTFFVSNKTYIVDSITEVHGVAGTDGGAVTLQIQRLQGTEAIGSGDDLLATAFDLKGTADTVQHGDIVSTDKRTLNKGDRLSLEDSGVLTGVTNLTVTVFLKVI